MVSDPGVCPSLAKDGAPRCALKSFCRRIPVSAPLAGVGLLIAFLSTFGCLVRAPGLSMSMAEGDTLISVDYEVFGKVQGVFFRKYTQNQLLGASLVAQWLRICLPMQGTRVRALVWEDPTCRGATGPVSHNC
ncbi:acylphosphatase-1 isoform X2 [Eubalaena glacialis]|uniref:acylphosphatase-1 isoform X2 n=1 Tax=Eubalaena glacialis TaxID=27606 RepID=UPI002A5A33EA|nr:acylphosphatase-1 isoform X2 [Eubalaena glacialis]